MTVLRTHIVWHDGYLQPLFECEDNRWFVQWEDLDDDYRQRTIEIPADEAKKMTAQIIESQL